MFSLKFALFFIVYVNHWVSLSATGCQYNGYDFSPLDGFPWIVETVNGTSKTTYRISICKELSSSSHRVEAPCQHQTAVCRGDGGHQFTPIGNFTTPLNITEDVDRKELWMVFKGAPCTGSPGAFTKTIINFKCGKTLGSPHLLDKYACDTYFEWHTTVACKNPPHTAEVKCHVYDSDGNKRDLSPLIKQQGGYLVDSAGDRDFYINVCREIKPNGTTQSCPAGASSCEISGNSALDRGKPVGQLSITADNKLYLLYRSDNPQPGCDSPPTTSITFICPQRGGGREPLLTSDLGCHYDVEWVTEYACPEQKLVSNTCILTQSQHDIEFDLTPLRKESGSSHPYKVELKNGTYDYFLNVCGELGIPCSSETTGVPACQVNGDFSKIMGRVDHQTLRYSDGELTLTYRAGATCSSHFQRETVINFHCNRDAPADGLGWPVFNREDNCTYLFDWDTKYACLSHALPTQCHVRHGNHRFDLSALIREGQANWEALRSTHIAGETDDDRYFLNICHDVLQVGVAAGCPAGSAVCLRDQSGSYINLGEYVNSPTYDAATGALQLHYTAGGRCNGEKKHETYITLKCKPGDLESGPDLVRSSVDGCTHEFEWKTAAACALSTQQGSECSVTDADAGYSIDLTRLRKSGDNAYYMLTTPDKAYDFYINVCGSTTGSPCEKAGKDSSAVCQVSRTDTSQVFNTGNVNQVLSYYNGLVNLTYTGGDLYHSIPPHPRSTEIAFLCQPDTGVGQPEFLHEANYTYSFRWLTSYVCPEAPVECMVTDPESGKQYDLSSLARAASAGNWETSAIGSNRKFYLNVCRPVNPLPGGTRCDPQAAACMTTTNDSQPEVVGQVNLGQADSGPTIEGDGQVLLTYRQGAACTKSDGTQTNYATKIHLRCQPGQLNQAPRLISSEDCTYVFLWETATACPLGGSETIGSTPVSPTPRTGTNNDDCSVQDPNSEFVFDLKALRKTASQINYAVGDLRLNICGPVQVAGCNAVDGKPAAVCNGTRHVAGVSTALQISDNGRLSLTYEGTRLADGQKRNVVILFSCNKASIVGALQETNIDPDTIEITMETALACAPEPVDCVTTDQQGREYDLSLLSRSTDNWLVMDPRMDHADLTYYINVCHTLNPVTGVNCPGGAIGGCQVNQDGTAYNLGYIQSKPIAGHDGSLSIRYLGGDICHKGTPLESRRSTRIIFECSSTQSAPILQSESADCEYIFVWKTPSACPLQSITGAGCLVTEPLYHYTFDLSHLRKVGDHDYEVSAGEYKYLLNVCGPLNAASGECEDNVSACQTKTGPDGVVTTINAGKTNDKLRYNDGELTLIYEDGKGPCHGKYNRKSVISFVCDHTTMGSLGPSFINESSDCTYLFEWRTSMACMSFQLADCTIKNDQGQEFDLSALTLTDNNYVYDRYQRRYLINVCTSLVHMKGVTCPPNSAACYIDREETDPTKKYVKIGEAAGRLLQFDDNGNIVLTYKHGQNCSGFSGQQRSSVITFLCKNDAIASSPTLVFVEDECVYHFVWETRVACPVTDPAPATNNCTVRNPVTGYLYNLIELSKPEGYITRDSRGHELSINICGPLASGHCQDSPGACQREVAANNGPWNAGKANGELHFIDGDLFLKYSGGDICHHNNLTRNTIINFVCAKEGTGIGAPVFVDEDGDCNYFVSWHTELACERQVRCEVEDDRGNVLDLSPLVRGSGSHLVLPASDTDSTYYINVCRPLNPIPGALCPPQAAACKLKDGEKPTSLGRVSQAPVFDEYSRNVFITYDHGVPCEKNAGRTNSSSHINFVCKPGSNLGQPVLEMITNDCIYMFEWETNVVCTSNQTPKQTTDCRFTINSLQYTYDLTPLTKKADSTTGYRVTSKKGTYYINICSSVIDTAADHAGCGGAAVCLVNELGRGSSYGVPSTQQYIMEGGTLKVFYTGGKPCGSGKAASYFLFECNMDVKGLGQPELFSQSTDGCEVVFRWQTMQACRPLSSDCSLSYKGDVFSLSLLSRQNNYWNVTDGYGNAFWLNVCQGLRGLMNTPDCPSNAAVCRKDFQGKVETLGLIQTQRISMADDEKTIIVEFSQGTNACAQKKLRRSIDDQASVRIYLQCGDTVESPVYMPRKGDKDSCAFEFTWKSPAACRQRRVPASEVNSTLVDPRSGGVIDLEKFKHLKDIHIRSKDNSTEFYINLLAAVNGGAATSGCQGAAVCQKTAESSTGQTVGTINSRKFYITDGRVEAEFSSDTECPSDATQKASTVIFFHCSSFLTNDTVPVFRTKSESCRYLFDWYTPDICIQPMIHRPSGTKSAAAGPTALSAHASKVGVVIGVVVSITILIILIAIFSKADRRNSFRQSMRRIFHRRHGGSLIKYSTLSSLDEEESLIPDNSSNTTSAALPDQSTGLPTFEDDSDEDLIL